ncbi:FecCD family ABC transporter permease [Hathewaya limosa]|uniref:Iron complex transport system permease protein n=1 Tax=Hathewaya limosa TaxID=1536 RepID=A0ABU0JTT2_HATLI|nr:iron ABC transporter permease [Hathewaya limosa]MDQ0480516.1 iron complex transport system permease protein [Hathewaya limosa]
MLRKWESNKKVEPKEISNTLNDDNKTKFYRLNIIFILIIGAIVSFFISNMFGTMKLSVKEICTALINTTMDSKRIVIWNVRVPRSILAALVGINLSISGAILQGVMKNPLADPGIIGISSGAGLTGIVLLIIFPEYQGLLTPVAFLGAMGAALLIYALAWKGGIQPMRVILSGVAVSSLLGAGISALLVFYSDRVHGALMFMTGGLSARSWPQVSVILPYTIIGVIIAILLSEKMNILILGDDVARSLGLNVEGTRMIMTAVAAILAASAVSVVGLLGFVGLIVPHTARIIVGSNYKYLIPTSGLLGAIVLLLCDTLSRTVFSPVEIPVGVVMAVLGAPFFLYLLRKA